MALYSCRRGKTQELLRNAKSERGGKNLVRLGFAKCMKNQKSERRGWRGPREREKR